VLLRRERALELLLATSVAEFAVLVLLRHQFEALVNVRANVLTI
jgi:hypothetical protein